MKQIAIFYSLLLLALGWSETNFAQAANSTTKTADSISGYRIKVIMRPFVKEKVYLRHYFGNQYPIVDSAMLDAQSTAIFSGKIPLKDGIYLIFFPDQSDLINILISENQDFTLSADLSQPNEMRIRFFNSPENDLLNKYQHFSVLQVADIQVAQEELVNAKSDADSAIYLQQLQNIDRKIQDYREDLIKKNPQSFLSTLLIAMREPTLSSLDMPLKNRADTVAARQIIQNKYWEGVQFWDGRLAYTPFFVTKMDKYLSEVLNTQTDTVLKKLDYILGFVATNDAMTELLLPLLLDGARSHRYKWDDAVFLYLFDNFVANKSYPWLTAEARSELTNYAYYLMRNSKGKLASPIVLPGADGRPKSLDDISAKYILVCFWDPTCHHCLQTLPKLDSIYQAKWKAVGMKILSVGVESDGTEADWLRCIEQGKRSEWTHVYNSFAAEKQLAEQGKSLVLADYNVWYFPAFFLLDNEKHLLAKKLSYPQMVDFFESLEK